MASIRTGRGDDGTTNLLYTNRRVSKTHPQIDLTHALDCYSVGLGQLKLLSPAPVKTVITEIQQDLITMMGITAYGSDAEMDEKLIPQCVKDPSIWRERFDVFAENPIPQTIEGIELCQSFIGAMSAAYSQYLFLKKEEFLPSSQIAAIGMVFDVLSALDVCVKAYLHSPKSPAGHHFMYEMSIANLDADHPVVSWRMWSRCLRRNFPFFVEAFPEYAEEFAFIFKAAESTRFVDFERGLNTNWFSTNSTRLIQEVFETFQKAAGPIRGWVVAGHNTVNFMAHELRLLARAMETHLLHCYPIEDNQDLKEAYRFFNILSDLFFCLAVMSETIE